MSQYLIIKKNGVTLGEWSRSHKMYQVIDAPYNEDPVEFNPEKEFKLARETAENHIQSCQQLLEQYDKMLEGKLSYDERWECLCDIQDIKEEIREYRDVMIGIAFMLDCYECDTWSDDPQIWTWEIG